jgi:hypothetical protein
VQTGLATTSGNTFLSRGQTPPPRSRTYMAHCPIYRGAELDRCAPKGLLKLIPPPTEQLSTFCIDLVTDLPRSNQSHDAILPITDRLTKWVRVLQGRKDWSAEDWAKEYYERMYEDVGLPEKMISDRDGRSLSAFWQEICSLANVDCSRVVETLMTSCSVASFARTSSCKLYYPTQAEPSVPYQTDESKAQINVIFRLNKLIETSETQNLTNKVERFFSFIRINSASFPNSQPNTNIACCAVDFVHS